MVISVKNYENARVHTVEVQNKKHFWVRMSNVQKGLGIKT